MMHEPAQVLDYRNPRAVLLRDRAHRLIVKREAALKIKFVAMVAAGIPLSFIAPALCTTMFTYIQEQWHISHPIGGGIIFALASIVLIPLLHLLEHRTHGQFLLDAARAAGVDGSVNDLGMLHTASRGEWELQTAKATWAAWIEIFLFAPRLTMSAIRQWKLRRDLGRVNPNRAADLIIAMLAVDRGVETQRLSCVGETSADLHRILLLLSLHGWIGISKRGDKVWLHSDARATLDQTTLHKLS